MSFFKQRMLQFYNKWRVRCSTPCKKCSSRDFANVYISITLYPKYVMFIEINVYNRFTANRIFLKFVSRMSGSFLCPTEIYSKIDQLTSRIFATRILVLHSLFYVKDLWCIGKWRAAGMHICTLPCLFEVTLFVYNTMSIGPLNKRNSLKYVKSLLNIYSISYLRINDKLNILYK